MTTPTTRTPRLRGSGITRNLALLRMLTTGHYSLLELANEFHVAKRTVYRDLQALMTAGFPITSQEIDASRRLVWTCLRDHTTVRILAAWRPPASSVGRVA